jgi:transposase InsO family protein
MERVKEIAETRVRYGYRHFHGLLRREGWRVNAKRVWRLYREMGLPLRNKTPKRRVIPKAAPADSYGDSRIAAGLIQGGAAGSRHAISGQIARGLFG